MDSVTYFQALTSYWAAVKSGQDIVESLEPGPEREAWQAWLLAMNAARVPKSGIYASDSRQESEGGSDD